MADAGTKILATEPQKAFNKIKEMRTKWGLTAVSDDYTVGNVILDDDARNMYTWLSEGKTKSKWTGTVPTTINVTAGNKITEIFTSAYNTAESIRTYCACNCNHCSCNCNHCSCNCNNCCDDGNNN